MIECTMDTILLALQRIVFITWTAIKTYLNGPYYSYIELNRNYGFFGKIRKLNVEDVDIPSSLEGKVCIITGGSRGIGMEVVKTLLRKGCHVITGSSASDEEIQRRRNSIVDQLGDTMRGRLDMWPLELSSMDSVLQFVRIFKDSSLKLHYLICNGAVMFAPFGLTSDGFETHLAINYFSHCLLISHLIDNLVTSGRECGHKSRIVCVSSGAHRPASVRFNDLQSERLYSTYHAYAQSKLAQIMFVYKFHEWLLSRHDMVGAVTITCLHPGVCRTDLMKEFNFFNLRPIQALPIFRSAEEGAETTLYATLSSEVEGISGVYLEDCCVTKSSKRSYDKKTQELLWNNTWHLLHKWTPNLCFRLTPESDKVHDL
ncbi:unnamed protein product [Oppiella nova]|uniref:Dehydrogenase/reductase SDR family member on chromosome X n=1 Tax=Oppiella nova TaxID=334625 RepID=A0A7R9LAB2_9ACAR|nr:unnamed protein product [Oppiella nova]CAG2161532.1 unnamed protein product [Oppiella nova]